MENIFEEWTYNRRFKLPNLIEQRTNLKGKPEYKAIDDEVRSLQKIQADLEEQLKKEFMANPDKKVDVHINGYSYTVFSADGKFPDISEIENNWYTKLYYCLKN